MNIRTEIRLSIGVLLGIVIVTALSAIVLLTRMSPAVRDILERNASSIQASESMLMALSVPVSTDAERAWQQRAFEQSLARGRANVTEDTEVEHLDAIAQLYEPAFAGELNARRELVSHLDALAAINHEAMRRTDHEARALGRAGAWAAVFLAIAGFFASVMIVRRLVQRIVEPVHELHDTALAWQRGDPHRRCVSREQPLELEELAVVVNALLDERQQARVLPTEHGGVLARATPVGSSSAASCREREALLGVLDTLAHPAWVVDLGGELLAANVRGLDLLADAERGARVRTLLVDGAGGAQDAAMPGARRVRIGASLELVTVDWGLRT